ncbi:protein mono-ADP-ribosyltransferase PARP11-like [Dreissena polymorpha]|nr:protein mono-ADP-ribosyltransferase PARP11-like [Dreissena polymorpha]
MHADEGNIIFGDYEEDEVMEDYHQTDFEQAEHLPHYGQHPNPDRPRRNQFCRRTDVYSNPREGPFTSMADAPQWRWYWQDSDNKWKPFEPDSLQQTLETKFLANQVIYLYSRENYKWNYAIDFRRMTQKNVDTGAIRKLNRRNISTCVPYRDRLAGRANLCLDSPHVIDVESPPSWVPWDVAHPFELVLLQATDQDCMPVLNNFYQTMIPGQHVVKAVFRVQNHTLWSAFCNQEKSMLNNQKRLGDSKPVDKRYLFHGTDGLDNARGICINNFDFRLCGKNATVYGHERTLLEMPNTVTITQSRQHSRKDTCSRLRCLLDTSPVYISTFETARA